jgi:hypothetical protein
MRAGSEITGQEGKWRGVERDSPRAVAVEDRSAGPRYSPRAVAVEDRSAGSRYSRSRSRSLVRRRELATALAAATLRDPQPEPAE